ncbi:Protein of unknown function DUF3082 [Macleaya cordata]|uniref:Transmembrane protein n=1 Tax=Macleaya cordata TaxID=56857 RepID=A0A200PP92_MACCD|nr:Protein of unknown function DUF3082 [Macleaya cordata]
MLQSFHHLSTNLPFPLPLSRPLPLFSFSSSYRLTTSLPVRSHLRTNHESWLAQVPEPTTTSPAPPEEGPIQLPPSISAIFSTTDDPSPLQVATSVLLTGAISVFLFRSLKRRAKRAKELKYRSTGAKKTLKDEALDNLKAIKLTSVEGESPPSPIQALLGGLTAGVIALVLYKFTTTIEAALNRQTISDSFSVRQITITIRTIVNGLCYLATFVFGINSIGLIVYSGQLAINSFMDEPVDKTASGVDDGSLSSTSLSTKSSVDNEDSTSSDRDQRSGGA